MIAATNDVTGLAIVSMTLELGGAKKSAKAKAAAARVVAGALEVTASMMRATAPAPESMGRRRLQLSNATIEVESFMRLPERSQGRPA